jgi:hypothetical protein
MSSIIGYLTQAIKNIAEISETELSKETTEKIFMGQGFIMSSDAVQNQLEVWRNEKFIEWKGDENIYIIVQLD